MRSVFHPGIEVNLGLLKMLFYRWLLALPMLVITQVIGNVWELETNVSLRAPTDIYVSFLIYI